MGRCEKVIRTTLMIRREIKVSTVKQRVMSQSAGQIGDDGDKSRMVKR